MAARSPKKLPKQVATQRRIKRSVFERKRNMLAPFALPSPEHRLYGSLTLVFPDEAHWSKQQCSPALKEIADAGNLANADNVMFFCKYWLAMVFEQIQGESTYELVGLACPRPGLERVLFAEYASTTYHDGSPTNRSGSNAILSPFKNDGAQNCLDQDQIGTDFSPAKAAQGISLQGLVSALQAAKSSRADVRIIDLGGVPHIHGDLSHLVPISHYLQILNISFTNITGGSSTLSKFSKLELLDLQHAPVSLTLEQLGEMTGLQIAHVNSGGNVGGDIKSLEKIENLRSLLLMSNYVYGDLGSIAKHKNLEHLVLTETFVNGSIQDISLDPATSLLRTLYVNALYVDADTRHVAQFPNLARVMLPAKATGSLDDLASFTNLQGLGISGATGISGNLATLARMTNMEDLDFSETSITGNLNEIKELVSLKVFMASSCPQLCGNLAVLGKFTKLQALDLSKTRVEGNLDFLKSTPQLKSYRLGFLTKVTADVTDLCPSPQLAEQSGPRSFQPEHVNLEGMHGLEGNLDTVASCFRNLKELNIGNCPCVSGSISSLILRNSITETRPGANFGDNMKHPIQDIVVKGTHVDGDIYELLRSSPELVHLDASRRESDPKCVGNPGLYDFEGGERARIAGRLCVERDHENLVVLELSESAVVLPPEAQCRGRFRMLAKLVLRGVKKLQPEYDINQVMMTFVNFESLRYLDLSDTGLSGVLDESPFQTVLSCRYSEAWIHRFGSMGSMDGNAVPKAKYQASPLYMSLRSLDLSKNFIQKITFLPFWEEDCMDDDLNQDSSEGGTNQSGAALGFWGTNMPRSRWIEFPSWRMRTLNLKDNKLLHYLPYRTFSAARYSSGEGEARRRSMLSSSTLKKVRSRSLYRWSFQLDIRNTDLVSPWAQDRDLGRNMLDPSEGETFNGFTPCENGPQMPPPDPPERRIIPSTAMLTRKQVGFEAQTFYFKPGSAYAASEGFADESVEEEWDKFIEDLYKMTRSVTLSSWYEELRLTFPRSCSAEVTRKFAMKMALLGGKGLKVESSAYANPKDCPKGVSYDSDARESIEHHQICITYGENLKVLRQTLLATFPPVNTYICVDRSYSKMSTYELGGIEASAGTFDPMYLCFCKPGYAGRGTFCSKCDDNYRTVYMMRGCQATCRRCPFGHRRSEEGGDCELYIGLVIINFATLASIVALILYSVYAATISRLRRGVRLDRFRSVVASATDNGMTLDKGAIDPEKFVAPRLVAAIKKVNPALGKFVSYAHCPQKTDPFGEVTKFRMERAVDRYKYELTHEYKDSGPSGTLRSLRSMSTISFIVRGEGDFADLFSIHLLDFALENLKLYMKFSESWGDEVLSELGDSSIAEKYTSAYDVVQGLIETDEGKDKVQAIHAAADDIKALANKDNYVDTLDHIAEQMLDQTDAIVPQLIGAYSCCRMVLEPYQRLLAQVADLACERLYKELKQEAGDASDSDASDESDFDPCEVIYGPVKGPARALEKAVLRPGVGVPWDLVRGQIKCTSCSAIIIVLKLMQECTFGDMNENRIAILGCNDRFLNPAAGWRDVSMYFVFPEISPCVCELQIVHEKLVVAREQLGAHDSYEDVRFARELLRKREFDAKNATN
jgi:hypothetical protein